MGDPRAGRRLARLLRPHERLGAEEQGQPGLGYIFWRNAGAGQQADRKEVTKAAKAPTEHTPTLEHSRGAGPIAKNLGPERAAKLRRQLALEIGDAVFFVAGNPDKFYKFAGEARTRSAAS